MRRLQCSTQGPALTLLVMAFCLATARAHEAVNTGRDRLVETIAPTDDYELCVLLVEGQVINYSFIATRLLDFNLHYHLEREVVYPDGAPDMLLSFSVLASIP